MPFVFLLGGARSGKSATAKRLAIEAGGPVTFIATAEPMDDEMAARIQRHRDDRPADWRTVEAPIELQAAVASAPTGDFLIVDCLTLWVSNLLAAGSGAEQIIRAAEVVAQELVGRHCVVVSNEVGLGIVPVNELARAYRDVLGGVNSTFAESADRALLMVAGRTLELTTAEDLVRGN
jgi:adenosyl cobinamide kinase/adenosyl cobinamide phosphate guanylyltransferase